MFIATLYLFHGTPSEIGLPTKMDENHELILFGMKIIVVVVFGAAVLISLKLTKYQK